MSGYREHSFDPNAYEQPGPPLKPYNMVQWTGVALGLFGTGIYLVHFAGRVGWIPKWIEEPSPAFVLPLIGLSLINSRRAPSTEVGSEQLEKNRRVLLITVAVCAVILGPPAGIEFSGA